MPSRRLIPAVVCVILLSCWATADDKKSSQPAQYSQLRFTVVKDDNNKPVRNASVILHPVNKNGTQGKGGYQLKTDNDGNTETEGIPYGPLRVQVIAPGFQTFGDDYQVNQATMDIKIRLKRPSDQFTTYDKPKSTQPPADSNPPPQPKPN